MSEYQRGVSAWNFDVEDLKVQASLIQDDEYLSETKEDDGSLRPYMSNKEPSTSRSNRGKPLCTDEVGFRETNNSVEGMESVRSIIKDEVLEVHPSELRNQEAPDGYEKNRSKNGSTASTSKHAKESNNWKIQIGKKHQTYSGPLIPSGMHNTSLKERGHISERSDDENQLPTDKSKRDARKNPNLSGPLMLPNRSSANSLSAPSPGGYGNSLEDKSKANVVQIRGRFSVTSENVDLVKDIPLCTAPRRSSQSMNQHAKETTNNSVPASVLMPHLQNLFQQTSFQQDLIVNLVNNLQQNELVDNLQTGIPSQNRSAEDDILAETASTERERLLLMKIEELQSRMISLTGELTAAKLKHIQLQEQLNALYRQEDRREE